MNLKFSKILITGPPRSGKTTLIKKAVERIPSGKSAGFYTSEILSKGIRKGFALQGLNGQSGILAHVEISSRFRVGKYGVDVSGFEDFLDSLDLLSPQFDCIVIDEIGKMEVFSNRFCKLVRGIANSEKKLLATIALKGGGFIDEIKNRTDIHLLTVTLSNRNSLLSEIF